MSSSEELQNQEACGQTKEQGQASPIDKKKIQQYNRENDAMPHWKTKLHKKTIGVLGKEGLVPYC